MISNNNLARKNMLNSQLETNEVNDARILNAIKEVPREDFVPAKMKRSAYIDDDIDLGNGKFLVEPLILARMLVVAEISSGDKVLDIASASGYSSAIISHLAKKVTSIDDSTKIVNVAKSNLAKLEIENVDCLKSETISGFIKDAPYDVIIINGEVEDIPSRILNQLRDGGRLVAIIDGFITRFDRHGKSFSETKHFQAKTRKLKAFSKPEGFKF